MNENKKDKAMNENKKDKAMNENKKDLSLLTYLSIFVIIVNLLHMYMPSNFSNNLLIAFVCFVTIYQVVFTVILIAANSALVALVVFQNFLSVEDKINLQKEFQLSNKKTNSINFLVSTASFNLLIQYLNYENNLIVNFLWILYGVNIMLIYFYYNTCRNYMQNLNQNNLIKEI